MSCYATIILHRLSFFFHLGSFAPYTAVCLNSIYYDLGITVPGFFSGLNTRKQSENDLANMVVYEWCSGHKPHLTGGILIRIGKETILFITISPEHISSHRYNPASEIYKSIRKRPGRGH